jgi:hypothetical protein
MALNFSNEEMFDMLECYIKNERNANRAMDAYFDMYPERRQPGRTYFQKLVRNLLEFGSFNKTRTKKYEKHNEERNRQIREHFNENPTSSTRRSETEIHIAKSTIHDVLKATKYHPYKPKIVQGLQAGDFERRVVFCNWYINRCQEDPDFSNKVLWSDETHFSNCGVFNKKNHHYWAIENPELREPRRLQVRFGFNVWCGLIGKFNLENLKLIVYNSVFSITF